MTVRRTGIWLLLIWLLPAAAAAQNSVYGLAGLGFPGLPIGVRARALGGGLAAFDAASALNPATVVVFRQLAATATLGTTFRGYSVGDSTVSGLRETRFPFGLFGGRVVGTPFSFAVSFATYGERSYDVTSTTTQMLRGQSVQVTDRVKSDGAVTDLRGALALRVSSALMVGGAVHLIGGSSRLNVQRSFSDTLYLPYLEQSQLVYSGTGLSAGVVFHPARALELAGAARIDGKLQTKVQTTKAGTVHLPASLTGGLRLLPVRGLGWSTTATRRSWSRAQPDLVAPARAFDTWEIASGVELRDPEARGSGVPLRVGFRYRQLPFSNVATQPSEVVFAGGTGLILAGGRALVDLSIERFRRSGAGATERGWQIAVGVMVLP